MADNDITSMPCFGLDLLISRHWEWRELENFIVSSGCAELLDEGIPETGKRATILGLAHQLCHGENRFSAFLERQLDRIYENEHDWMPRAEIDDVLRICASLDLKSPEPALSFLWKLHRDPRPGLANASACLSMHLQQSIISGFLDGGTRHDLVRSVSRSAEED